MRDDVRKFAEWMSDAMNSKAIERDSREEPHYLSADYPIKDAVLRLQDKTDQLVFWAEQPKALEREKFDRVRKTAVHLANFCMIIAAKCEAEIQRAA